ncbi:MAG: PaaI family thioesterase [Bacteroidales bacterium]|nr:PaaI family thioesterase [Bacteroidales bacterium]
MKESSLRRKILNPYTNLKGYNCFGCSPNNIYGLRMEFVEEGDFIISEWIPVDYFSGYKNVLHGGVQATLMDEIASWVVQIKLKTAGVTANLNIKYKKPVFISNDKILIKARIEKYMKKIAYIHTELYNSEGELCSEGEVKYFIYPEEYAREKLYFPEYDRFFEK